MRGASFRANLLACALLACTLLACGGTVPAPAPSAPNEPREAAAPQAPPQEPRPDGPLRRIWMQQTPPFQLGLVVTDEHVVTLSTVGLSALSLRDGEPKRERDVCLTFEGALGRLEGAIALVCEDEIQLYSMPELALVDRKPLRSKAVAAAFAPGHLAVASVDGMVRVLARADWSLSAELEAGEVDALALTEDGATLAVARGGQVFLLREGAPRKLTSVTGPEIEALVFASDGSALLVAAGPATAIHQLDTGDRAALATAGPVQRAAPLDDHSWALAGAGGLLIYAERDQSATSVPGDLGGRTFVALRAGEEGRSFCLSDRDGRVAYYGAGEANPSAVEPVARDAVRMAGHVRLHGGRSLAIEPMGESPLPDEGANVRILRFAPQGPAGRWREIARGSVETIEEGLISVRVDRAVESMWGTPEQVPVDARVELAWGEGSVDEDPEVSAPASEPVAPE